MSERGDMVTFEISAGSSPPVVARQCQRRDPLLQALALDFRDCALSLRSEFSLGLLEFRASRRNGMRDEFIPPCPGPEGWPLCGR